MVKNAMDSSLGFALTVSAVCCPVEKEEHPAGVARYVQSVLEPVFHPAGIEVEVTPLAYQTCGKVPVIITLNGKDPPFMVPHGDVCCGAFRGAILAPVRSSSCRRTGAGLSLHMR